MSLEKLGDFYKSAINNTTSGITGNGTSEPLGVDDNSYSVYNEKCLFSSTYSCQTGALSDDFTKYQRLRLRVGWHNNSTTTNEGDSYIEVSPEPTAGANVAAIWNVGNGTPGYICVGRVNFPTTTSFNGTVGKLMQFDGNVGNTGWEGQLRPIKEVWGINKQLYRFFGLDSEEGTIQSNKTLGYRGDTATLTVTPASDEWKCSAINITGAELTGNDFMFNNSNVSAQAEFEHFKELTLENGEHGVLSADKMTGFSGDVVTVDATTDEGWYLSGIDITGAVATGTQFMFIGNDVTALGKYTDVGFPVTYLTDEHVQCTGDTTIYIPGGTGITLETGYDPYYRISGYEVVNGSVENGVLIPTGPCTIRAVATPNYFTATGGWEKGSNVNAVAAHGWYEGDATVPAKYAIYGNHTGDIPSSWYNTSNRWNVNSDVSSYSITLNPIITFSGKVTFTSANSYSYFTGISLIGSTSTQSQTFTITNNGSTKYDKTITSTETGVNYGLSAHLHTWAGGNTNRSYCTAAYIAAGTTGTWTATGIAP